MNVKKSNKTQSTPKKASTNKDSQTLTLKSLFDYLNEKKYEPVLQEEQNQVVLNIQIKNVEFPLIVKILDNEELVQFLAFFPANIKEGAEADTARTLHLLNKELDLPGFGMDDVNGLMFFRYVVPFLNQKFETPLLEKLLQAIPNILGSFFPLLYHISQGKMSYHDVYDKYDEMTNPIEMDNPTLNSKDP